MTESCLHDAIKRMGEVQNSKINREGRQFLFSIIDVFRELKDVLFCVLPISQLLIALVFGCVRRGVSSTFACATRMEMTLANFIAFSKHLSQHESPCNCTCLAIFKKIEILHRRSGGTLLLKQSEVSAEFASVNEGVELQFLLKRQSISQNEMQRAFNCCWERERIFTAGENYSEMDFGSSASVPLCSCTCSFLSSLLLIFLFFRFSFFLLLFFSFFSYSSFPPLLSFPSPIQYLNFASLKTHFDIPMQMLFCCC